MISLFKPFVKELPFSWFSEKHNEIATTMDLGALYAIQVSIEKELERFELSRGNKVKLIMLSAYCNLRINLLNTYYSRKRN